MAKKVLKGMIIIDSELCKGCGLCISVCPHEMINVSEVLNEKGYYPAQFKGSSKEDNACTGCATCAIICPDVAIEVYRER
ncbi:MAG: ferredoxin family protein [Syntrophales bacterium]|jgi:2-oxoglutarate ferredoxin oxidoreductase subunit delta|nr:ferredoxin family protein [Syntrophales bacterium]MDY0044150.1 ferredoxin family protein [Syntrophales bacterium]